MRNIRILETAQAQVLVGKDRKASASGNDQDLAGLGYTLTPLAEAQEVARRTKVLLDSQGWCLWECSVLDGETIAVVADEGMNGIPEGYPVYTLDELAELSRDNVSDTTLRLVQEAKKACGVRVLTRAKLGKKEFGCHFLLAVQGYAPKAAVGLVKDCRDDIELFGLEYARRRWSKLMGIEDDEAGQEGCDPEPRE